MTKYIHELKVWPIFYDAIVRKEKRFEVRFDDRDYKVGDTLVLMEWLPDPFFAKGPHLAYTGRQIRAIVCYMMKFYGYPKGWSGKKGWYVIMDIEILPKSEVKVDPAV